jgi:hypothetical protein
MFTISENTLRSALCVPLGFNDSILRFPTYIDVFNDDHTIGDVSFNDAFFNDAKGAKSL